jgi:hypothetical protein
MDTIDELEELEKNACNLPLIFSEILKDEINANDEEKLYNGMKRMVRKYSNDAVAFSAIDEFVRVLSGGTSLKEIFLLAKDEVLHPTISSEIRVDNSCDRPIG